MVKSSEESSISGYLGPIEEENISTSFTDIEPYVASGHSLLLKAKRQGRWWLLKGLKREYAGASIYLQMLRKEFDITNRMSHPGIVTSSELTRIDGKYAGTYIVMEWIDGMTLDRWLSQPHTRKQKLNILNQLLVAVDYIHRQGIVHRDLKPENVMITHNGDYMKVIDFGLADAPFFSILKQPAGTIGYMSPEQQRDAVADVRNDIYSLGSIIRKMDLGRSFRRVINKCMGPIDSRYANMAELSAALHKTDKKRWTIYIGATATVSLMVGGALWFMSREKNVTVDPITEPAIIEQEAEIGAVDQPNDTIQPDSANNTIAETHSVSMTRETRKTENAESRVDAKINEAIARGIAIFDAKADILEAHLDTLSRKAYLEGFSAPSEAWKDYYYIDCAKLHLSSEEADRIYITLQIYENKRYNDWYMRLKKIP